MKKRIIIFVALAFSVNVNASVRNTPETKRSHPYLFFSKGDIPEMRKKAATSHIRYFNDLKKWADNFTRFDPLSVSELPSNIDIMQVYCENSMSYIFNMSLIFQLTGDQVYLDAAKKWLLMFSTYPSEIKGNFCVGAYAIAIASGYDILYEELTTEQRTRLKSLLTAVVERGKKGTVSDWWAGITLNHDHWLPVAGLGVGAAALYYEEEKAPGWFDYFLDILKQDIEIVGDDGAWTEGTADWVYGMSLPYVFFDVYKRMSGVNMFNMPFVKNQMAYRLYNWLPDDSYIYHHDSFSNGRYNVLGAVSSNLLHKLAMEHKNEQMQWLASRDIILDLKDLNEKKSIKEDWHLSKNSLVPYLHCVGWNFLWYDEKVKPATPDNLSLEHYFKNQGLVIKRTGWKDSDVVFSFTCSPVGGHNARKAALEGNKRMLSNFGHTHAQANAFDIYAYGTYLAVPPAYGSLESNQHSTLTIEGAKQQRNPKFNAVLLKAELKKDYTYLVGDATDCYPSSINLDRWYRHTAFFPPNSFIIADELKSSRISSSNQKTTWHLVYNNILTKASFDSLNQTIWLKGKSALHAKLLYPVNFSFENKRVSWAAFQVNASIENIFRSESDQQIIAVIDAVEKNNSKIPVSRLIKDHKVIGAVSDNESSSRAAVFFLDSNDCGESFKRTLNLSGKQNTTCYLFSLKPNRKYDVAVSCQSTSNNLMLFSLSIKEGDKYTSNSDGTIILNVHKSNSNTLKVKQKKE